MPPCGRGHCRSGWVLPLKEELPWIQPQEIRTEARNVAVTPDQILAAAKAAPRLEVESWDDIARADIRPDRGLVHVHGGSNKTSPSTV